MFFWDQGECEWPLLSEYNYISSWSKLITNTYCDMPDVMIYTANEETEVVCTCQILQFAVFPPYRESVHTVVMEKKVVDS